MPDRLHIECFALGPWMTNAYVIHRRGGAVAGDACWIIDAGYQPQPMIDYLQRRNLVPSQVILTHAHLDHIGGLHALVEIWPRLPILVHRSEKEFLTDPMLNLSAMLDEELIAPPATGFLEHGQKLTLEPWTFEVRHTPGHSPGGITLYQLEHQLAIVGDTLFAASIGRYDFPTSDGRALLRSIQQQLMTLPDETRVLPGHGPETTVGQERQSNPYLQSN